MNNPGIPSPAADNTANASVAQCTEVVEVSGPLDLRSTMAPLSSPADPTGRTDASGWWKALHTADGPATVRVRRALPQGHTSDQPDTPTLVELAAWGSGAQRAVAQAHGWLGLDDRVEHLDFSHSPVVHRLFQQHSGLRLGRFGMVAERIVPVILGQKVIAAEADRSYRRLTYRFSEPAPGPGPANLHLPIPPELLARIPMHDWHLAGVEQKRALTVRRTMRYAKRLDDLIEGSPAEAYAFMQKLPGIGPWTAAAVGAAAFGDPDVVLVGDYNLPHLVSWALAGERRGTDQRMMELLEPFTGQRARVLRLLKMSGNSPPRRGPKLAFRSIEDS